MPFTKQLDMIETWNFFKQTPIIENYNVKKNQIQKFWNSWQKSEFEFHGLFRFQWAGRACRPCFLAFWLPWYSAKTVGAMQSCCAAWGLDLFKKVHFLYEIMMSWWSNGYSTFFWVTGLGFDPSWWPVFCLNGNQPTCPFFVNF